MAQWGKLSYAQKTCLGKIGKLMMHTAMLRPGARIGVAASGGVDSWLMLQVLLLRQRIVPFPFEIMALHINPGFDPANHAPLVEWCAREGVALHAEATDHGPRAHSEENRKNSACFFCAMLRRNRLFTLCREYGLTHLAFAHTVDDLAATFLMNLVQTGKVYGLAIKEEFFSGRLTVIRPTLGLDKKVVVKAARDFKLPVWQNPCPSAGLTKRTEVESWLSAMCGNDRRLRRNIRNGLLRWQLDATNQIR
jgi:tRNA 2-thiocytidine biosynthesis protein TtcA